METFEASAIIFARESSKVFPANKTPLGSEGSPTGVVMTLISWSSLTIIASWLVPSSAASTRVFDVESEKYRVVISALCKVCSASDSLKS